MGLKAFLGDDEEEAADAAAASLFCVAEKPLVTADPEIRITGAWVWVYIHVCVPCVRLFVYMSV